MSLSEPYQPQLNKLKVKSSGIRGTWFQIPTLPLPQLYDFGKGLEPREILFPHL